MKFYQLIRSVINKIPGSQRLYNTLYNTSKKMQPQEHEVIQFLSPGDLFFDIGAHTGEKSKPFINKNFEVVMVEPQPKCIEELQRLYSNNPLVHIVPMGLGSEPGMLEMNVSSQAPTLSTFTQRWKTGRFVDYKWDQKIKVPITTLDELISKYGIPKYIKIDVEGFELQVLKGLTKKTGIISFEFTSEFFDDARTCLIYLCSIGYENFNFSLGEQTNFSIEWTDHDSIISTIENLIKTNSQLWGDIFAK